MFTSVFVAGTFDGMHKGHTALLSEAFVQGKNVIIGLTSDKFVKKLKKTNVRDFGSRKRELGRLYPSARIIPIDDVHEPAASMPDLDAIVVSTETAFRAREINELRRRRHLRALATLEVPMVAAQDRKPISSTRLRHGEIDRDGRLIMPDNLRPELAKPLGRVLIERDIAQSLRAHRSDTLITVGDVATETLITYGVIPALAIIDQKVGRKPYEMISRLPKSLVHSSTHVQSGPGFISEEAIEAIRAGTNGERLIIVDGEEDLLAIPAIVHAPIGGVVYYGQPKKGLVEVLVTEEKKRHVLALLKQFT